MSMTIRMGRRTPAAKSDELKQDAQLWTRCGALADWLRGQDLSVLTTGQVFAFAQTLDPRAALAKESVWYEWVWDPVRQMWFLVCHDRGTIAFSEATGSNAIEVQIDVSAMY